MNVQRSRTGCQEGSCANVHRCRAAVCDAIDCVPHTVDHIIIHYLRPCLRPPVAGSLENTRAALHFANTAKKVVMRPQVNEVVDDKTIIRRMQLEIEGLKQQLVGGVGGGGPGGKPGVGTKVWAWKDGD